MATPILKSLWGRVFGLGHNNELVLNGQAVAFDPTTGAGTKAASSTVEVEEQSNGIFRQTKITLTNAPLSVVSVTTGNGVGGLKLYTFPEGYIHVLGSYGSVSLSIASAKQGDFTDATPEGDLGIGSLLPANADSLGTDATDDDICTARPFTMSSYAASVNFRADAATLVLNGSSTAEDVNLTVLVDAADIDNDVTTEILATGTIYIRWIFAGDI